MQDRRYCKELLMSFDIVSYLYLLLFYSIAYKPRMAALFLLNWLHNRSVQKMQNICLPFKVVENFYSYLDRTFFRLIWKYDNGMVGFTVLYIMQKELFEEKNVTSPMGLGYQSSVIALNVVFFPSIDGRRQLCEYASALCLIRIVTYFA